MSHHLNHKKNFFDKSKQKILSKIMKIVCVWAHLENPFYLKNDFVFNIG